MRNGSIVLRFAVSLALCTLAAVVYGVERAGEVNTEELHTIHFATDTEAVHKIHFTVHKDGSVETAALPRAQDNQHQHDSGALKQSDLDLARPYYDNERRAESTDPSQYTHVTFHIPSDLKSPSTSDISGGTTKSAPIQTVYLTMPGNVDDYTSSTLSMVRIQLATRLGVPTSSVSVAIYAGSVVLAVTLPASSVDTLQLLHSSGALKTLAGQAIIAISTTPPVDRASKKRIGALEKAMAGLKDEVEPHSFGTLRFLRFTLFVPCTISSRAGVASHCENTRDLIVIAFLLFLVVRFARRCAEEGNSEAQTPRLLALLLSIGTVLYDSYGEEATYSITD